MMITANSMEVICEQIEVEVDKNKERSMIQVVKREREENGGSLYIGFPWRMCCQIER